MKKKILGVSAGVLIFLILICRFGRGIYFFNKYRIPDKEYFGNQYSEVLCPMSIQDKKCASDIMTLIDKAFSFIGTKEDADNKFGELSRYCVENNAVTETHRLKLVTSNFKKNEGYLWFVYSTKAFDNNGELAHASLDILVRLTLQKKNDEWVVVNTQEHP